MELSERFIRKLEAEGFDSVYEWQDEAGKTYAEHSHAFKTTIMVTDGSIAITMDGQEKVLSTGQRLDIPAGVAHSALVGEAGAIYIVGETSEDK